MGGGELPGQLDIAQQVLAPREAVGERGLATRFNHQQLLLEPQPPVPALRPAPRDQGGRAVEAIAHQHRPHPRGQQSRNPVQRRALLSKADGALRVLHLPGERHSAPAHAQGYHNHLVRGVDLALVDDQPKRVHLCPGARPPTRRDTITIWCVALTWLWSMISPSVCTCALARASTSRAKGAITSPVSMSALASRRLIHW